MEAMLPENSSIESVSKKPRSPSTNVGKYRQVAVYVGIRGMRLASGLVNRTGGRSRTLLLSTVVLMIR